MPINKPIPTFKSTLPPEFLDGLDDRGRYLYTKIDEMGQANTWLLQETSDQSATLQAVKTQTEKTNGRLLVAESDIRELKDGNETLKFVKTVVKSRWFWVGVSTFFFVVLPWLTVHAPPPAEIIGKIWAAFFG